MLTRVKRAQEDLLRGLANWRLWHLLGLGEIRRRYARSVLGQFWLTLSTAVMVCALAFVWSTLWKVPLADFMPFVAVSLIIWNMVSGSLGEATTVFISSGPFFLNQGMSFSTAIFALMYRQVIMLLHNLPIIVVVFLVFSVGLRPVALLAFPGFALLLLSLFWLTYVIAVACVRFRDLSQVVQSLLTVAFFITPVLWRPDQIPQSHQHLLAFNPLAALLAVVRDPLLGHAPPLHDWIVAGAFAIGGLMLALPLIGSLQRRIIYWI